MTDGGRFHGVTTDELRSQLVRLRADEKSPSWLAEEVSAEIERREGQAVRHDSGSGVGASGSVRRFGG